MKDPFAYMSIPQQRNTLTSTSAQDVKTAVYVHIGLLIIFIEHIHLHVLKTTICPKTITLQHVVFGQLILGAVT